MFIWSDKMNNLLTPVVRTEHTLFFSPSLSLSLSNKQIITINEHEWQRAPDERWRWDEEWGRWMECVPLSWFIDQNRHKCMAHGIIVGYLAPVAEFHRHKYFIQFKCHEYYTLKPFNFSSLWYSNYICNRRTAWIYASSSGRLCVCACVRSCSATCCTVASSLPLLCITIRWIVIGSPEAGLATLCLPILLVADSKQRRHEKFHTFVFFLSIRKRYFWIF